MTKKKKDNCSFHKNGDKGESTTWTLVIHSRFVRYFFTFTVYLLKLFRYYISDVVFSYKHITVYVTTFMYVAHVLITMDECIPALCGRLVHVWPFTFRSYVCNLSFSHILLLLIFLWYALLCHLVKWNVTNGQWHFYATFCRLKFSVAILSLVHLICFSCFVFRFFFFFFGFSHFISSRIISVFL